MKLTRQEKIIFTVFIIVLILGFGVFLFIVPAVNSIKSSSISLASATGKLVEAQAKKNSLSQIEAQIMQAHEDGVKYSDLFFDEDDAVSTDRIVREFINSLDYVHVDSLSIAPKTTIDLGVIFTDAEDITYPIKENAGMGVVDKEALERALKEQEFRTALAGVQTVAVTEVSFDATVDRGRLWDFIDAINNHTVTVGDKQVRKAMMIKTLEKSTPTTDEAGNDKLEVPVTLSVFSVKKQEKPNFNQSTPATSQTQADATNAPETTPAA